jgi:hypothetical protein
MTTEQLQIANKIKMEIETLEKEIDTLSNMERNTRAKRECTHRLCLKKLFKHPEKKTAWNYWSSQDLDSIHSIILFDADEVKVLIDFKQSKVDRLKVELNSI